MRLLFIGNSFTGRNDLPGLLRGLAAAAGHTLETEAILVNGASLRLHWNKGEAAAAIAAGGWDGVVLQEQSTLPIKNPARYHENVLLFHEAIAASGARTLLYLTWARQHAPQTQQQLSEATHAIAQQTGATIIPVGTAWANLLQQQPDFPLYDKDGSHPSPSGSFFATCVFYAALFGRSPAKLPVPTGLQAPEAEFWSGLAL